MPNSHLIKPGQSIRLKNFPTDDTRPFKDKQQALPEIEKNLDKLARLQNLLYAQNKHALLIVIQGMDTAGKDGAIKHVFSGVNPQGCAVTSFKQPSHEELQHDYLWRIHDHAPAKGMIGIFNRSHYESVLIERVHRIVPKEIWKQRYAQINNFEKLLADEGTVILKFFLHISKQEQKRRLESRLKDPAKNWKFDPADLAERKLWNDYQTAYEDALTQCSTPHAPWHVVPADHKWFRNWLIADTIVKTLEKLNMKYPPPAKGIEKMKVK
jgi:PPK2 family polyphosphate:nucleotide phosphotransferase